MPDMEFGKRLDRYIQQAGLSNRKLAERIGVSPASISQYIVNGRIPESGILLKLAQELNVTMEELLTGKPPLNRYKFVALIELVDRVLAKNKISLRPEKRRIVMEEVFDYYIKDINQNEKGLSAEVLKLARLAK